MKPLLLSLLLVIATATYGQGTVYNKALADELGAMYERDQKPRRGGDSARYMDFIDSTNLVRLEAIIKEVGWPGISMVGTKGNQAVWAVVQHSPLEAQEKYYPMMEASVQKKESQASELAYLEDRILMSKGKPQKYGTQISNNPKTGAQTVWPIADEKNVNKRRAALLLQPMEEYALHFGIEYKLPKD